MSTLNVETRGFADGLNTWGTVASINKTAVENNSVIYTHETISIPYVLHGKDMENFIGF